MSLNGEGVAINFTVTTLLAFHDRILKRSFGDFKNISKVSIKLRGDVNVNQEGETSICSDDRCGRTVWNFMEHYSPMSGDHENAVSGRREAVLFT